MFYIDQNFLFLIIVAILIGGIIKGTLGVGLPMIAVPLIAFVLPPTTAMILLCFQIL